MRKRLLSLLLTVAMLTGLVVVPANAAPSGNFEVKLSTVSFTEDKANGKITETGAKTEFKEGETFALKIDFVNGSDKNFFANAIALKVLIDKSRIEDYSFSDEELNEYGPFFFNGKPMAANEETGSGDLIIGVSDNTGVGYPKGKTKTICYYLFKVKKGAETGNIEFSFKASEGAGKAPYLNGDYTKNSEASFDLPIDFESVSTTIKINGVAPVLKSAAELSKSSVTVKGTGTDDIIVTASAKSKTTGAAASGVKWTGGDKAKGVIVAENGQITVKGNAAEDTYTITGTGDGTNSSGTATATLTVNRETAVLKSFKIKGDATIAVAQDGNDVTKKYSVDGNGLDQYGSEMAIAGVTWSVDDTKNTTGVEINESTGVLTVQPADKAGDITVKATVTTTAGDVVAEKAVKITKAAAAAAKIENVSGGPSGDIVIPADGADDVVSPAYVVKVTDQYGAVVDNPTVTWTVDPANKGVTVADGVVTVSNEAKAIAADTTAKPVTVTASIGEGAGKSVEYTVNVKRADPAATTMEILKDGTVLTGDTDTAIIPADASTKDYVYTSKIYDQYGTLMEGKAADLTFAPGKSGLTFDTASGKLSVTKAAAKKDQGATLTAKYTGISPDRVITITPKDIEVPDLTADDYTKNAATYGDNWTTIITGLNKDVTANVGTKDVKGEFYVKDDLTLPGAGAQTCQVYFKSNDETYKDIPVPKGKVSVTIAKKALTITANDKTISYNQDAPAYDAVDDGYVTGEDRSDLGGTLTFTDSYTKGDDAGKYTITPAGLSSENYDIEFVNGKLTVSPAKVTGFTAVTKSFKADDEKDADALKAALGTTVTASYADGTATLPVEWNTTATFNPKGAEYTYTGTVTYGTNFTAADKAPTATVEVTAVTGAMAALDPVVKARADVTAASDYTALGLPASVTIGLTSGTKETLTHTPTWDKTVAQLKAVGDEQSVTVTMNNLPAWLTMDAPTVNFKVTAKYPVKVTLAKPTDITYGGTLTVATPTQTQIDGKGTAADAAWTYLYKGKTNANVDYSSDKQPTEAGNYTVTATLVSATYAGESAPVAFTIKRKAPAAADFTFAAPENLVYDGTVKVPTVVAKSDIKGMGEITTVKCNSEAKNAAEYTVKIDVAQGANYAAATSLYDAAWEFTITAMPLAETTPVIRGTAKVGEILVAGAPAPVDFSDPDMTWTWTITDVDGTSTTVSGVTLNLTTVHSGAKITLKGSASSGNYSGSTKDSAEVVVEKQTITGAVTITGMSNPVAANDTLTADLSGIYPADARVGGTYQWIVDGKEPSTGTTYTVQVEDANKTIKVVFTPAAKFLGTAEASVVVGRNVLSSTPRVSGTPAVDQKLTLSGVTGTLGTDYTVQWLRDGAPIAGATQAEYTVVKADQGHNITVRVTGINTYTGTLTSAAAAVSAATPDKPVVTATAGDGKITLTWKPVDDNGASVIGYLISKDVKPGPGWTQANRVADLASNETSYTVTGLTNGTEYTFFVTASNIMGMTDSDEIKATPKAPSGGGGGSYNPNPTIDKETVTNPDGSVTVTETKKDGTTVATTTDRTGNKTVVETKPDGSSKTDITNRDGSKSTTTVDQNGKVDSKVTIPNSVIKDAEANGQNVNLPMPEVSAGKDGATAPTITVNAGQKGNQVTVVVPVKNPTAGTVVEKVNPDGSTEIIPGAVNTENGMLVPMESGSTIRVVNNTRYFTDVDGHWAKEAIDFMASRGYFKGTGDGTTFSPDMTTTRAMIVTVLWRIEGCPVAKASGFDDVKPGDWFAQAVAWASAEGIVTGYNAKSFGPNDVVTREQMAAILYRYLGKPDTSGTVLDFPDADQVPDWALDGMKMAVANGLIKGMGDGTLAPQGSATRAMAATIFWRFILSL